MRYQLVTAATKTPVTLPDFATHSRIDISQDSAYVSALLEAATEHFERATGTVTVEQSWRVYLKAWEREVRLPQAPLLSITSVIYKDVNGDSQTLAAGNYVADVASEPGKLLILSTATLPGVADHPEAIAITYKVGYATPDAVPERIKTAIRMIAANWYENREAVISGTITSEVPLAVRSIIESYRTGVLG